MRHTSVKTTLDIYSHVDDDTKKNVAKNYAESIIGTSFVGFYVLIKKKQVLGQIHAPFLYVKTIHDEF